MKIRRLNEAVDTSFTSAVANAKKIPQLALDVIFGSADPKTYLDHVDQLYKVFEDADNGDAWEADGNDAWEVAVYLNMHDFIYRPIMDLLVAGDVTKKGAQAIYRLAHSDLTGTNYDANWGMDDAESVGDLISGNGSKANSASQVIKFDN